ncbi:ATP synthase F1 subunit gamma [Candidatus Nomurabacteria bacterium]|nr:ATP synthase F1 subunit gamma [Candidatus Nomurabacteria bacterium]USN94964.1 MAG: ATP synthase F1 subunit gamma [Candidatus Nomurabacteria bacterium]
MSNQIRLIKQKITSVKNIGKVTKTMEMISVAKMKKASERAVLGKPYSKYALELLHHISKERNVRHTLMSDVSGTNKVLLVVISSNKGLCGSYNVNISKALSNYKKSSGADITAVTIGKQSEKAARRNGIEILGSFIDLNEKSTAEDFAVVRDLITKEFLTKKYRSVKLLFTEYKSISSYKPFLMQVLPVKEKIYRDILSSEEEKDDTKKFLNYLFEPDSEEVLGSILEQLLEQALYHAFLESVAAEHTSRMAAMKNASDSASGIVKELTVYYNRERQAGITKEISEIIGGSIGITS